MCGGAGCGYLPVTPSAVGAIGLQAVPLATATRNPAAGAGAAAVPVPVPVPVVVVGHMVGVLFVSEVVCWFAARLKARGQRWVGLGQMSRLVDGLCACSLKLHVSQLSRAHEPRR